MAAGLEPAPRALAAGIDGEAALGSDDCVLTFEWRIARAEIFGHGPGQHILQCGEALESEEFALGELSGLRMRFFPVGREWSRPRGHCAVELEAADGLPDFDFRFRVGTLCVSEKLQHRWWGYDGKAADALCSLEEVTKAADSEKSADSINVALEVISVGTTSGAAKLDSDSD
mmetsp:Transcript_24198/g.42941  ORF Transcript_24198/g.42941 Transcript_24198/m.42941 type:complete len:173 (+) Transcript_24198:34-552(+)